MILRTHKGWLDRLCSLRIKTWRYRPELDPKQMLHVGPLAEDWQRVMGVGDGVSIDIIDACGILMKCVQELTERVHELEAKFNEQPGRSAGGREGSDQYSLNI